MRKDKTQPAVPELTQLVVNGTDDVWTIIPEAPGFNFVRGEEEPENVVLIDATNLRIYIGEEAIWHSIGHAIECAEKISRQGHTFEYVAVETGKGKYAFRE